MKRRGVMRIAALIVMCTIVCAVPAPVFAQSMGHKVGRGLLNVATGWLEILKGIRNGSEEEHALLGIITGLGRGAGRAILRTAVGVVEVVTFPIPYPSGYAPILEPEYVFD